MMDLLSLVVIVVFKSRLGVFPKDMLVKRSISKGQKLWVYSRDYWRQELH